MLNFRENGTVVERMYSVVIDGREFKLNEQNTQKLIDIVYGMMNENTSVATNPKSTKLRSVKAKDYKWTDRTIVYSVDKHNGGYVVNYSAFSNTQQLFGKRYISLMMNRIFADANLVEIKYCAKNGKVKTYSRPFFKTQKAATEYVATLPTVLKGEDCKKANDEIFAKYGK